MLRWRGLPLGLKTYGLQSLPKWRGLTLQFLHEFMLSPVLMLLRRGWRNVLAGLGMIVASSLVAQPAEVAGTMPEDFLPQLKGYLATALKQSPTTITKQLDMDLAQSRIYLANSGRLPGLRAEMNYSRNKTANSDNSASSSSNNGLFYNIQLNQALFHWGALQAESDKARIGVYIADKSYKDAYRALAVVLRRSYLELMVKKALLVQMTYVRDLKVSELDLIAERLKDGRASEGEQSGKKLELEDWNIQIARTRYDFNILRRTFGRLAGVSDPTEDSIPTELAVSPQFKSEVAKEMLIAFVKDNARSVFQAQVAELKIREADLTYRIARVRQLPKFNAGASYNLESTTNATATSVSQEAVRRQTISVGASWNIFDGFATRGAKLEALTNRRKSERELESITETVLDGAQGLAEALPIDAEAMRLADVHRTLSRGLVETLQRDEEAGRESKNSIALARASLKTTEYNLMAARANFLSRWAEFVSVTTVDPVLTNLPARYEREKR